MNNIQTLIIDILNEEALEVLENMEAQNLIRARENDAILKTSGNRIAAYKGAMKKQTLHKIEKQLKELRGSW